MNHWHCYLTAILLLGVAQSNSAESRVALVNGNAAYPDTPIKSPVKDARVISKTPRGLGFDVITLENASKRKMESAILDYAIRDAYRNKPFQRRFQRTSRVLAAQVAAGAAPPVPASRLAPEMVVIPAGRFLMGSPKSEVGRRDSEGPQHQVTLARPFRIGKYEVSVAEYSQFVEATGYRTEAEREGGCYHWDGEWKKDPGRTWRSPGFSQAATHPVVCVSWNDAVAYAEWLTRVTGGGRYRLPTEAEWEYVARSGTTGARYWGENLSDACEYANVHDQTSKRVNGFGWTHHDCDDGRAQTAPVGSYRANGFGLHDVLGNVLEWTGDCWNDSYRGAPSDGSAQESGSCARRVLRGGSWDNIPGVVRAANRGSNPKFYRDIHLGFRLAQDM